MTSSKKFTLNFF